MTLEDRGFTEGDFKPSAVGRVPDGLVKLAKIERELGWAPRDSLQSGLGKTVGWFLDNRQWWEDILNGTYKLERLGLAVGAK